MALSVLAVPPVGGESGADAPRPAKPQPFSLLVVTLDTWRWDHLGASGSGKVATPALDAMAGGGAYEPQLVSPCPLTTPAHATLFTGLDPLRHGVLDCVQYTLDGRHRTLAEILKARGYRTAAFLSGETLHRRYGLNQGFDHYDDAGMRRRGEEDWLQATRDGAETTGAALAHLRGLDGSGPLFLWVHYFDAHIPYRPRPGLDERHPGNPYAAQVEFLDGQVDRLVRGVEADAGRSWKIVIVGDHGEGLGDHGESGHGIGLYASTVHVPLILHPRPEKPLRLARPWGMADLFPTVLEWLGAPVPGGGDGRSLFASGGEGRVLAALTLMPSFMYQVNPVLGVRRGPYWYLRHGVQALYNADEDPGQKRDLSASPAHARILRELRRACGDAFPDTVLNGILRPTIASGGEDRKRLRSLGYLAGPVGDIRSLQRADIGRLLGAVEALDRERERGFRGGGWEPLARAYRTFLETYPRAPAVLKNYGKLLLNLGRFADARAILERAVAVDPSDADSLINLGTLLLQAGEVERARGILEAAVAADGEDPVARKNLAILCHRHLDRPDLALPHYRKLLAADPGSPDAPWIRDFIRAVEEGRTPPP